MNIKEIALEELDNIVLEEYGIKYSMKLYEADDDDDGTYSTPFRRMGSFPARAIRYKKAKSVMKKYVTKIIKKADKIINRFQGEINKSVPIIDNRGRELDDKLEKAKRSGDETQTKSIINQQKKFTEDVANNQKLRVDNLQQSLENLINTYTQAIHKRVDEPGYVLKVELSEKGKADLKFLWDEYIAIIKQQIYEKLIKILDNKHLKGLEDLISKLEIQVQDADDNRKYYRRSRKNIKSQEEKTIRKDSNTEEENEPRESLLDILEDELPDWESEEYFFAKPSDDGEEEIVKFIRDEENPEEIIAVFQEGEEITKENIKDERELEDIIDQIHEVEEEMEEKEIDEDELFSFEQTLFNHIDTIFSTRSSYMEKALKDLYERYEQEIWQKDFSRYVAEKILKNPKLYKTQYDLLKRQNIPANKLITLFFKRFASMHYRDVKRDLEEQKKKKEGSANESFISLSEYKKRKV
jgi:hypothetical protein